MIFTPSNISQLIFQPFWSLPPLPIFLSWPSFYFVKTLVTYLQTNWIWIPMKKKKHFCVQDIWLPSECHHWYTFQIIRNKKLTNKVSDPLFNFSPKPARCSWRLWFTIFNDKRSHFLWSFSAHVVLTFHFAEMVDSTPLFGIFQRAGGSVKKNYPLFSQK